MSEDLFRINMKLLDEIIEVLSSNDGVLSEALVKTKILLHEMGHKDLVVWVNKELNGYVDDDELPDYRIIGAQVLANVANSSYRYSGQPMPLSHLEPDLKKEFELKGMYQSLPVIEKLLYSDGRALQFPIPMEANGLFSTHLANGYKVQNAWSEVPLVSVGGITMQVRSRLLDFILELRKELSPYDSLDELVAKGNKVDATEMFNNNIFGDNTTVIIGSNNHQTVKNKYVKNDFDSLRQILENYNVDVKDINNLEKAIDSDSEVVVSKKNEFGPEVRSWIQIMLSKAVDASWNIELGVASSLIATALNNYYGLI